MSEIPSVAKAWRYPVDEQTWNGHKSLELRDVKISPPNKGEVLVKLHAVSLNYRDIMISSGELPGPFSTGPDGLGLIPASDGAGEVVAVGDGVSEWKKGDRVHSLFFEGWLSGPIKDEHWGTILGAAVSGCLTQYRIFPKESLLPIPSHLSYEEAATLPCAAVTAWHAFFEEREPLTKDSTVLVLGSGGVSVLGAQLAKAAGACVIATTSSKEKEAKYKALGVGHVINYREHPEWSEKVKELTGGLGVDHILEVGGEGTLIQSVKSTRREKSVHVIGAVAKGSSKETISELAMMLLLGQVSLSGLLVGSKEMAKNLGSFLTGHTLKPVIDRVFEWTQVVEALDYQVGGSHFGKIVVKIQ
ncbi:zinc-type alcohol dehydrogenase-like protein [Ceratobasidium sp. AG-I]|nr:zinc-type alcohol dehydrogenase-like protein [Ceratobasidium sp. AG-I]